MMTFHTDMKKIFKYENMRNLKLTSIKDDSNGPQMSRKKRKEKKEFIISSNPSLVAPVSEVAEEKYFCPLLIWGWLRKRRNE